ncbi:hypothetical protein C2S52_021506, partial [Perilla frutescens var. hirtella]
AWKLYESGMHEKLADETLDSNEYKAEEVKKMVEIALVCTQSPATSRPSMSEILAMLLSDGSVEHRDSHVIPSDTISRRIYEQL